MSASRERMNRHGRAARRIGRWSRLGPLLLAATLSFATGCSGEKNGGVERLKPRGVPYLDGVPVPANFSLVDKMSEDHESGAQRTARHEYRGFANPEAVRAFYREQMPLMGWSRVSDRNVKGTISIRFEKRNEACTIQIEPNMINYTTVRATIDPFNRTTITEPPKRPVP